MKRIVITGDRPRPLPQHKNIEFFYYLLHQQLMYLTGAEIVPLIQPNRYYSFSEWLSKEMGFDHYPIEDISEKDFVIVFEPSREMLAYLKDARIHFVAFDIAPYRFLDDLCFNIIDAYPCLLGSIKDLTLTEFEIQFAANYMLANKNRSRRINEFHTHSVLLVGQSHVDRSVIGEDGVFKTLIDFEPEIKSIIKGRKTYFKPHPYFNDDLDEVCKAFDAESVNHINIYDLLSNELVRDVISLSSSVGHEALYFKRPNTFMLKPKEYNTVIHGKDFIQPMFWARFLKFDFAIACEHSLPSIKHTSNLLRIGLGASWGYDLKL